MGKTENYKVTSEIESLKVGRSNHFLFILQISGSTTSRFHGNPSKETGRREPSGTSPVDISELRRWPCGGLQTGWSEEPPETHYRILSSS